MKMKIQQLINISRVCVWVWMCVLSADSSRTVAASAADTSLEMIMETPSPHPEATVAPQHDVASATLRLP